MRFRKLRIAWAVVCALVCVLFLALWARSYSWVTNIQIANVLGRDNQLVLSQGTIHFSSILQDGMMSLVNHYHRSTKDYDYFSGAPEHRQFLLHVQQLGRNDLWLIFPYWFAAAVLAAGAAIPWLRCKPRFCLRTLFVSTTVVAVLLGLIVAVL